MSSFAQNSDVNCPGVSADVDSQTDVQGTRDHVSLEQRSMTPPRAAASMSCLVSAWPCAAIGEQYEVTNLGILPGGTWSEGYGISAGGQVSGIANLANGNVRAAKFYCVCSPYCA